MGYHAVTLGTAFPTFRTNAALLSSWFKTSLTTTALRVFERARYINRRIFTSKKSGIINYSSVRISKHFCDLSLILVDSAAVQDFDVVDKTNKYA